jgi:hypothetical protein
LQYGYRIEYAFIWTLIFVTVGAIVYNVARVGGRIGNATGLAYSFDMLLPLVRLDERHYKIEIHGWPRYYFYFHKLVGWGLGLMVVAAVSGIAK